MQQTKKLTKVSLATTVSAASMVALSVCAVSVAGGMMAVAALAFQQEARRPTVTVALSPQTPPAGVLRGGEQRALFTAFSLTVRASRSTTLHSITVERVGSGDDAAFEYLELLDAGSLLPVTDPRPLDTAHRAVFKFTADSIIAAGESRQLVVAATLRSDLSPFLGQQPALAVVEVRLRQGGRAPVGFPVVGNAHLIVPVPLDSTPPPPSTPAPLSRLPLSPQERLEIHVLLLTMGIDSGGQGALLATQGEPHFLRGDANQNQRVDIADAAFLVNYLLKGGPAPLCLDAADANDSGQVDIIDVLTIDRYMSIGWSGFFPSPGPSRPGPDPTPDALGCGV